MLFSHLWLHTKVYFSSKGEAEFGMKDKNWFCLKIIKHSFDSEKQENHKPKQDKWNYHQQYDVDICPEFSHWTISVKISILNIYYPSNFYNLLDFQHKIMNLVSKDAEYE